MQDDEASSSLGGEYVFFGLGFRGPGCCGPQVVVEEGFGDCFKFRI